MYLHIVLLWGNIFEGQSTSASSQRDPFLTELDACKTEHLSCHFNQHYMQINNAIKLQSQNLEIGKYRATKPYHYF